MIKVERFIITPDYIIGRCLIPNNIGKDGKATGGTIIYTLELPYRDNQKEISCIPTGLYNICEFNSPKFGLCIKIDNDGDDSCIQILDNGKKIVRENLRIHIGNSVRDFIDSNGIKRRKESSGCLLSGMDYDEKNGLVYRSREALNILLDYIKGRTDEKLLIEDYKEEEKHVEVNPKLVAFNQAFISMQNRASELYASEHDGKKDLLATDELILERLAGHKELEDIERLEKVLKKLKKDLKNML